MAKEEVTAEVAGLQISNNTFSASPPGSLLRAEECVMPQKGVIEPRRGQAAGSTLATASTLPFALTPFDGAVITNYATSRTSTSYGLGYTTGGASVTAYSGTYNPVDVDPSGDFGRMKFAQAGGYLQFCTSTGPKTLEAYNDTPRDAGLLRMPDPVVRMGSASNLGANGVGLPYGYSRAYCSVLRKPTSNGTSLLSPPSGRQVVENRVLAPVGSMVRAANVVTVTLPGVLSYGLLPADTFTIDPGEANFPAALETVSTVTDNVLTYADVAADATNTVAQDLDTGPRPVNVFVSLSEDATTTTPVRVYRSLDSPTDSPSDEMFLVAEIYPDNTDISNGFLLFPDVTPEAVLNEPLYTNPQTGEGARAGNFKPPMYRDVAVFDGCTWYLDTTGFQQLRIQMLGVGAPDGVQNNDTITIDGEVFTFKTTPTTPGDVQIVSNGTPSFNIQQTAQFLIEEIFEVFDNAGTPIRAYYESPADDAPGQILLEATDYTQASFEVEASRVESWTPALPADSLAERLPNGLSRSKPGQPEAVPPLNATAAGAKNFPGLRILALQQALLVFKRGDGIYAITGTAPTYTIQQISTANIVARDAACVFSDAAWVYTDEGILRISDSGGATVVSRPIETELQRLYNELPEETADWSFAVPYEQERRVMFFVPFEFSVSDAGDRPILRAWCFNNATNAWTGPLYYDALSGVVTDVDGGTRQPRLYLGLYDNDFSTSRITIERNGQQPAYKNYLDVATTTSITEVDVGGDPLVIRLASTTGLAADDLISQGSTRYATISAIRADLGTGYVEVYEDVPFTVGAVAVAKHYDVTLQFQPQGNPTARKTLSRLAWLFKPDWFASLSSKTLLATDQIQADAEIATTFGGFGWGGFGGEPFGDPSPLVVDINPPPPSHTNAAQFFLGFTMPVAWSKLKLQGFSMTLETASAPVGRGSNR